MKRLTSSSGLKKITNFLQEYRDKTEVTADEMCENLTSMIVSLSISPDHKGKKKKKGKTKFKNKPPWFDNDCWKCKKALNRADKIFKMDPFNRGLHQKLYKARKQFKSACKLAEKKMRETMASKLLDIEKQKPVEFWNLVKDIKNWGNPRVYPSDAIPPNEWLSHFLSLLNGAKPIDEGLMDELRVLQETPMFTELDYMITRDEIRDALNRINTNAAPGCDMIKSKFLVAAKRELMPLFEILFNKLFSHISYPTVWANNFLKSIFKKGDSSDPNNYRGIAIGSCLCKLYNLILLNRLEKHIESVMPISPNQIGFQKGNRTADHIFVLNTIINKIVKHDKKKLYIAFIDFRKAYDKINRTLLFLKLQRAGVSGLFYENLKKIYSSVNYLIKVKGGHLQ